MKIHSNHYPLSSTLNRYARIKTDLNTLFVNDWATNQPSSDAARVNKGLHNPETTSLLHVLHIVPLETVLSKCFHHSAHSQTGMKLSFCTASPPFSPPFSKSQDYWQPERFSQSTPPILGSSTLAIPH